MGSNADALRELLEAKFTAAHVRAALNHFQAMTDAFRQEGWEGAIGKGGKFVEAALKALSLHTGRPLPPPRKFKAGDIIKHLQNLQIGTFDDTVRMTIPRACEFVYDVASNRGARHDSAEVDPNQMDARVVVSTVSWILAELLRYSQKGALDQNVVERLVENVTERKYPVIEDVDGRIYFHVARASARDVALLSLWHKHPGRKTRQELITDLRRHRFSVANATKAVTRLQGFVDEDESGRLRLLQPGIKIAESVLASVR